MTIAYSWCLHKPRTTALEHFPVFVNPLKLQLSEQPVQWAHKMSLKYSVLVRFKRGLKLLILPVWNLSVLPHSYLWRRLQKLFYFPSPTTSRRWKDGGSQTWQTSTELCRVAEYLSGKIRESLAKKDNDNKMYNTAR